VAAVDAAAVVDSLTDLRDPGVEQTELPNGLRIVTETMPEARSISIGAWVRVGARDEPPELAGASHFLEHLLFKGTAERSAKAIAEAIDCVGGEMNAFTAREHTAYYARLPHGQAAMGLELLGDVLSHPALRPEEVEAERQVIVEEILMNLDSPEDRAHTLLAAALFGEHPLGREVLGQLATVEAIQRDDIDGFFQRWYHPGSMVVTAAGHLDHDHVVEVVAGALGDRTGHGLPARNPPSPMEAGATIAHDDTEQAHLCLGWRSLPSDHPDRWAMAVANQVLGGGMSSRLFQAVREERGLAYSVYSHPTAFVDAGYLTIYCGTAPKRAGEALEVIDDVVAEVLGEGITEQELAVASGYLEGSMLLGLEDSGGRMGRLGRSLVQHGEIRSIDDHIARVRAVTTADVTGVLRDVLGGPRVLAAVGPMGADELGL
jgi:predicted Zn-dependent peptidase